MAVMPIVPLLTREAPIVRVDDLNTVVTGIRDTRETQDISSLQPYINLANHNPGVLPIARTQPPYKVHVNVVQLNGSPATGRLSVEDLRQYMHGARVTNNATTAWKYARS